MKSEFETIHLQEFMINQRTKATSAKRLPKNRKNPNTLKKELNELRSEVGGGYN